MKNIDYVKEQIIKALNESKYDGDLSNVGNIIGITIANYFEKNQWDLKKKIF